MGIQIALLVQSYGNFAEWVELAYWWRCIGKGLRGRLVYIYISDCPDAEYDQPHESQTNKDILETIHR